MLQGYLTFCVGVDGGDWVAVLELLAAGACTAAALEGAEAEAPDDATTNSTNSNIEIEVVIQVVCLQQPTVTTFLPVAMTCLQKQAMLS